MPSIRSLRKAEHVSLAAAQNRSIGSNDFDRIRLTRKTLPEVDVDQVDLSSDFLGHAISAPLYLNAMTGGYEGAKAINGSLGRMAKALGIPLALGSATILMKEPQWASTFEAARQADPDGLLLVNVSANADPQWVQSLVHRFGAAAVQVHVNALQEASMAEGDRDFRYVDGILRLKAGLDVPIIVKEVGGGFDRESLSLLAFRGLKNVDVSGAGGTDFVRIEAERRSDFDTSYLADLSISTVQSLINAKGLGLTLFASGGIRNPLDVLKSLALGAKACGLAGAVLCRLIGQGEEKTLAWLTEFVAQLKLCYALLGINRTDQADKLEVTWKNEQ